MSYHARMLPLGGGGADTEIEDPSLPAASLTYEGYYGLREKPFSISANPKFLYKSASHAHAFTQLDAGIRRREGLIVLTGDIGTGKTTLCRAVLGQLDRRTFSTFVPDPFASREDFLRMLLVDFGVVSIADLKSGRLAGASRPDLSYPLYEFLDSLVPLQAFAVLVIDEAQNLSLPLLEEIRILADLERREKLLQVVLVGQPELRSNLKLPQMRQVDQRVSVRCELTPLSGEDVSRYVRHRLEIASARDSRVEFSEPAIAEVLKGSGGVPRVINLICDRALERGHAARTNQIGVEMVSFAIADLRLSHTDAKPVSDRSASNAAPATSVPERGAPARPQADRHTVVPSVSGSALSAIARTVAPSADPPSFRADIALEASLEEFRNEAPPAAPGRGNPVHTRARALGWIAACLAVAAVVALIDVGRRRLDEMVRAVDISPPTLLPPAVPLRALRMVQAPDFYVIQVAAFQSGTRAQRAVDELAAAGFTARAVDAAVAKTGGRLLQVVVGTYDSAEAAHADVARIREFPGFSDAQVRRGSIPPVRTPDVESGEASSLDGPPDDRGREDVPDR